MKQKNLHKSVWGPLIKKIRPLYFLQLLKFQEIKWSYFFHWRLTDRDIPILSFHNILTKNSIYNKNVRKWYLETKFKNSEGTLFSETLKVEENKVPSEI